MLGRNDEGQQRPDGGREHGVADTCTRACVSERFREGHAQVKKKKCWLLLRTEPDHDNDGVNLEPLVGVTQEAHVSHNQLVKKKKTTTTTNNKKSRAGSVYMLVHNNNNY